MTPHTDSFPDPRPPALTPPQPPALAGPLQVFNPHAAGIDIGEAEHWVAVPPDRVPQPVRRFGTFTADLDVLADWLLDCGITTVAMESTGVYWIPVFELLEARGLQVFLIDPRQAKRAPGRPKTDRLDCQWLQRLHAYGLLAAAFRPADQICVLRSYLRHRQMLLTYGAHHIQHAQFIAVCSQAKAPPHETACLSQQVCVNPLQGEHVSGALSAPLCEQGYTFQTLRAV